MDWLKIALNGLQIGSILATAGFAAFGLISKFKDDSGKLTRAGRIALAGIGLSAMLSLTTQTVKAEADRRSAKTADLKHQQELDTQLGNFKAQSRALTGLDVEQRRALAKTQQVQGQVTKTLAGLQLVQDRVGQSVLAIARVGQQQDVHTARVLRTMWNDANRIDGNRIELLMVNRCVASGSKGIPIILPDGAKAVIAVAPKSALNSLGSPANSFSKDLLLPSSAVTFTSMEKRVEVTTTHSVDTTEVSQYNRFGPFMTLDIGPFSSPESWRDAVVEILVTGQQPGLASTLKEATGRPLETKRDLAYLYSIPDNIQQNDDYNLVGLPCFTGLYLLVDGRMVAELAASMVQVVEHDEDVRGLVVIKSHVVPVDASSLPHFDSGG